LPNSTVKKIWRSVNICQSYGQKHRGPFFETQCIVFGTTCVSVKPAKSLVLPVIWLPYWISNAHRRPTKSEVSPLESLTRKHRWCSRWNFVVMCCALKLQICLGVFLPPPPPPPSHLVAGKRRKKPLPGEGLKQLLYGKHVLLWRLQPTSSTRNQLKGSCRLNRRALTARRWRVARGTGRHRHYLLTLLSR